MDNSVFLIVEDSPTMRQLISFCLKRFRNARIIEAVDGADGLKKLGESKVDLILTDINMPVMDGLKFVSIVRQSTKLAKIPIIIITTEGADEDREKGMALGANAYSDQAHSILPAGAHNLRTASGVRASSIATRRERAAFFRGGHSDAVIFTCLRLVLLQVRSPFFDELFTVWISRRSPGEILRGLLLDSGPPLYYWMVFWPVHATRGLRSAIAEVPELRLISLLFAVVTLLSVLGRSRLGESRWMAAILLTFFPASVYFSGEARAYALCAMFVAFGVLALERWASEDEGGSVALSLLWFFLAACSHYYGALFLAVPLVVALIVRRRRMITDAVIGTVIAGVLYAPLLWLASRQPPEAIRWMAAEQQQPGQIVLTMLHHLGFAAPFPAVFLPPPPARVQILSLAAVILALRSDRSAAIALVSSEPPRWFRWHWLRSPPSRDGPFISRSDSNPCSPSR